MNAAIYIDPEIDLQSEGNVAIIVQFKTKPAKAAVAVNKGKLTLDEAEQQVNTSHDRFQKELYNLLAQKQIQYSITHIYKDAYNGVSMKLIGNKVQVLLQSEVIEAIYANREFDLPIRPFNQMYQI